MAILRVVTVQIKGDFYFFGSRKYHREAIPATLREEIEAAVTASSKSPANRKSHRHVVTGFTVTATGKKPCKNPRT